ncbi:MAG: hypothetical protein WCI05_08935 [Myxococcales bacterium]
MDLKRSRVVLRERTHLDVLDLSVRFLVVQGWSYAKLTVVVLVPSYAASFALVETGGWFLGWLAALALASFAQAPFTLLASRLVFEDRVRVRDVLLPSLRRLPALLLLRGIQWTAVGMGFLFLLVPGLWLGAITLFVVEALILEQATVTGAFGRSQRMTVEFGEALSTLLLVLCVGGFFVVGADVAGRMLLETLLVVRPPPAVWTTGGSALALMGFWLFVPVGATLRFFAYLNSRTRREGWDIQTRFAALAARPEEDREER